MPKYEYACKSCGEHIEVVQSFADDSLTECPACGGRLRKVFGSVAIVLKGPGFYRNDHRTPPRSEGSKLAVHDKEKQAEKAERAESSAGSESSSSDSGGKDGGSGDKDRASSSSSDSTSSSGSSGSPSSGSSGSSGSSSGSSGSSSSSSSSERGPKDTAKTA